MRKTNLKKMNKVTRASNKNIRSKSLSPKKKVSSRLGKKRGKYKKRKKEQSIILIILKLLIALLIVLLIFVFMLKVDTIFNLEKDAVVTEKRELTYEEKYIGDVDYKKFPFLKMDLTDVEGDKEPDGSKNIVIGKNNWEYFIGDYEKNILNKKRFIDATWFKNAADMMENLDTICKEQNKEVYFMILPMKDLIYPEYLPDGYYEKENEEDDIELFTRYANEKRNLKLLYPLKFMLEAKKYARLYFNVDVHWNQIGGYIATEALYDMIGKTPKPLFNNDIIKMYGSINGDYDYSIDYKGDGEALTLNTNGREIAYADVVNATSTANDSRQITLVGDSFRYWIFNILKLDFAKANIIHKTAIRNSLSKEALINSDIIVVEIITEAYAELPYMAAEIINQLK